MARTKKNKIRVELEFNQLSIFREGDKVPTWSIKIKNPDELEILSNIFPLKVIPEASNHIHLEAKIDD